MNNIYSSAPSVSSIAYMDIVRGRTFIATDERRWISQRRGSMTVAGIRTFARKGQLVGMGLVLGSTLLMQSAGASTAVAAEGTAKKGEYCSSWEGYKSGSGYVKGQVRTCLGWLTSDATWRVFTHTKGQEGFRAWPDAQWIGVSNIYPANWTAVGTVQINSTEAISYSHKKRQVTGGAGDDTIIRQGIKCGNRTVTRTYKQVGPVSADADSMTIDSGNRTLSIPVPCA
ncbi:MULTISPECIES: hypothetical protein [unclassified Streptomyces]|uniref:hypothetical protein n=1 Tax=unclassified Streptomyces TaxID=2593676 RepID=UPI0034201076